MHYRYCIGYVWAELLQNDLDEFGSSWNSHHIRKNRVANCPPGVPNDLFLLPEHYGMFSYLYYSNTLNYSNPYIAIGTSDYIRRPVSMDIFTQYCLPKEEFYPTSFAHVADAVLQEHFHITKAQISMLNLPSILCFMLHLFDTH